MSLDVPQHLPCHHPEWLYAAPSGICPLQVSEELGATWNCVKSLQVAALHSSEQRGHVLLSEVKSSSKGAASSSCRLLPPSPLFLKGETKEEVADVESTCSDVMTLLQVLGGGDWGLAPGWPTSHCPNLPIFIST